MFKLILLTLVFFLVACATDEASNTAPDISKEGAEQKVQVRKNQCLPYKQMTSALLKRYQEKIRSTGTMVISETPPAAVVVLFYTSETGTWSNVITGANGISCLVMYGDNYKKKGPDGTGI